MKRLSLPSPDSIISILIFLYPENCPALTFVKELSIVTWVAESHLGKLSEVGAGLALPVIVKFSTGVPAKA
jgi:hypothetical protein